MSSRKRQECPCGSGKAMRRCCGMPSSQRKLDLEATAKGLSGAGMHAEAARVLSERARLSPHNPMIWNDVGVEHVVAGQTQEAQEAFRRALKAVADYTPSLYNLGRLAIERCVAEEAKEQPSEEKTREFAAEAVRYLEKSLAMNPRQYQTHAALAKAYSVIGDSMRATFHTDKASELKPLELTAQQTTWAEHLILKALAKPELQSVLPFVFSTGKEVKVTRA